MNWRDRILKEFTPQLAPITLVADPDGLLTEAEILQKIKDKGFEVILFEDTLSFRYIYESQYRPEREKGRASDLVIIVNKDIGELRSLPYDLVRGAKQVDLSIGILFPGLSYSVVNELDRSDFDALYQAQLQQEPEQLGENRTKDFVLRYVYNLDPALIQQASDLWKMLLSWHYRGRRLPAILCDRLIQTLAERPQFTGLPLETIIGDRQAFFSFLQRAWGQLVDQRLVKTGRVAEATGTYSVTGKIPFDDADIKIYLNHLFLEGYLEPIDTKDLEIAPANMESNSWMKIGLHRDAGAEREGRVKDLLVYLDSSIPGSEAKHQDWLNFAISWARFLVLWHEANILDPDDRFLPLQKKVDDSFLSWVKLRYGTLHNQPPVAPVMLHQIPRFLARHLEESKAKKIALIVLDGLAFDQWLVLKEVLIAQRPQLRFNDETVFAWLPTITSISRQTIFAGKSPIHFPTSLETTAKEESLWKDFWLGQGLTAAEIGYAKGLGESNTLSSVGEKLSPKLRVLGLVVDKVDKIMHGMELGAAGMHNQVRQWAELSTMANLLDLLIAEKFGVFLTSDHGNIEATGIGQPREGAIADLRGERVRVYSDPILRTRVKNDFPDAIEWQYMGLPENYLPLFAPGRGAFIGEGKKIVAHGGISLEELIVPFISVSL